MKEKRNIVFFTGAGMSRESGLPTFRGEGGVWNEMDFEKVATLKSWYGRQRKDVKERRQAMLDFFNPLRRAILDHKPNRGHRIIASLDDYFEVTVITQNGDDYHTQAGSKHVVYLHGEALKNASSAKPSLAYPIDRKNPDIHMGDKAPDGSQLRPYVVYFGEDIDNSLWREAVRATKKADWFVVVGSSMLVYPAAELLAVLPTSCHLVVIDPGHIKLPRECNHGFTHIPEKASVGLFHFMEMLSKYEDSVRFLNSYLGQGGWAPDISQE